VTGTLHELFQPGNIGTLRLDNRLVMAAMGLPLADVDGRVTEQLIAFYRPRAAGGVGLVTTSFASVSRDAAFPMTLSICDDSYIPGLARLTDAIHGCGAKVCIQLMHPGMLFLFAGFVPEGMALKTPSITSWLPKDFPCDEIGPAEIDRYVEDFADAARRTRDAGADAAELHASNGCLVSTFLSPLTNRRKDDYGGSVANRARFARRIVERMKEKAGADFPVIVRLNVSDDMPGGVTPDEVIQQARLMQSAGANAINISSGLEYWTTSTIPCYLFPDGSMLPMAERLKQALSIPVLAAGKISPELGERIIAEGKADFIALGRPLLGDPELPNKIRAGRAEDVWQCLYCNNCLIVDPEIFPGACSVNPFAFREQRYPLPKTETPKDIMVVGGGLAGMRVAALLAERGHRVSLYEKSSKLGGQWNLACTTPGKERYASLTDRLRRSLAEHGVTALTGVAVTREMVQQTHPDVVVVATGAVPAGLNVPGATLPHVVQSHDVLAGKAQVKGRAVVVGGRFTGMEVAIKLKEQGRDVCLVSRAGLGENGIKLEQMAFRTVARKLLDLRVPLYLHSTVLEITERAVVMTLGANIFPIEADTVIFAVGMRPDSQLARELDGVAPELYTLGDCVHPRDAAVVALRALELAERI
jgi:2,4-dienoyl-CoA reductase-like NADH-dependent reductase (Old Yellow Enzyme family)/thioredoxin reductase